MARPSTVPAGPPAAADPDAPGSAPQRIAGPPNADLSLNPFDFLTDADLVNLDAMVEAGELYGDDPEREIADIEAGRHPLQRPPAR